MKKEREKHGGLDYVSRLSFDKLLHFILLLLSVPILPHTLIYPHKHTCGNTFLMTSALVQSATYLSRASFLASFSSSSAAATIHNCSLLLPSNIATVYYTTSASIKLYFLCDLSATIPIWAQYIASLHP